MANQLQEKTLCQVVMSAIPNTIFTCPPGETAIIRYIRIANVSSANSQFKLYIMPPSDSMLADKHAITPYLSLNAQRMYSEPCFMALEEGWRILGEANAEDRLVITIWGASLS